MFMLCGSFLVQHAEPHTAPNSQATNLQISSLPSVCGRVFECVNKHRQPYKALWIEV